MKTLKDRREELIEGLIAYTSCSKTAIISELLDSYDGIQSILTEFIRAWENADCDAEGATKEQDKELDRILDLAADEITEYVEKENVDMFGIMWDNFVFDESYESLKKVDEPSYDDDAGCYTMTVEDEEDGKKYIAYERDGNIYLG